MDPLPKVLVQDGRAAATRRASLIAMFRRRNTPLGLRGRACWANKFKMRDDESEPVRTGLERTEHAVLW